MVAGLGNTFTKFNLRPLSNMKNSKCVACLILLILLVCLQNSLAQRIPAPSSKATITNQIGFCDVKVEYGRPNVRGREIWGHLVPYDQVWRTGANYPTLISFSDTILFNSESVLPGKYSLYTIPNPEEWTIMLNNNTQLWGSFGYSQEEDLLHVSVKPENTTFSESFHIYFADVFENRATLVLHWGSIQVKVNLVTDHRQQVIDLLDDHQSDTDKDWGLYWKAAQYLYNINGDLKMAEEWIDRSLALEENWMNLWTKALLLAKQGKYNFAQSFGMKAQDLCKKNEPYCSYYETYEMQIESWITQR